MFRYREHSLIPRSSTGRRLFTAPGSYLLCWTVPVLLLFTHQASAQVSADSTASAQVATDSTVSAAAQPQDTTRAPGATSDSTAPTAVQPQDTAPAPGAAAAAVPATDTSPRAATADSTRPALVVVVDSALVAACASAPVGASAPGLLAVVFKRTATDADRKEAAKKVGGTLAGAGDSGEYIQLPAGATRSAAAHLIGLRSVSSVTELSCPH